MLLLPLVHLSLMEAYMIRMFAARREIINGICVQMTPYLLFISSRVAGTMLRSVNHRRHESTTVPRKHGNRCERIAYDDGKDRHVKAIGNDNRECIVRGMAFATMSETILPIPASLRMSRALRVATREYTCGGLLRYLRSVFSS